MHELLASTRVRPPSRTPSSPAGSSSILRSWRGRCRAYSSPPRSGRWRRSRRKVLAIEVVVALPAVVEFGDATRPQPIAKRSGARRTSPCTWTRGPGARSSQSATARTCGQTARKRDCAAKSHGKRSWCSTGTLDVRAQRRRRPPGARAPNQTRRTHRDCAARTARSRDRSGSCPPRCRSGGATDRGAPSQAFRLGPLARRRHVRLATLRRRRAVVEAPPAAASSESEAHCGRCS